MIGSRYRSVPAVSVGRGAICRDAQLCAIASDSTAQRAPCTSITHGTQERCMTARLWMGSFANFVCTAGVARPLNISASQHFGSKLPFPEWRSNKCRS
jgi:hypothetical protein